MQYKHQGQTPVSWKKNGVGLQEEPFTADIAHGTPERSPTGPRQVSVYFD